MNTLKTRSSKYKINDENGKKYYEKKLILQYFFYPISVGVLGLCFQWLIMGKDFYDSFFTASILMIIALSFILLVLIFE